MIRATLTCDFSRNAIEVAIRFHGPTTEHLQAQVPLVAFALRLARAQDLEGSASQIVLLIDVVAGLQILGLATYDQPRVAVVVGKVDKYRLAAAVARPIAVIQVIVGVEVVGFAGIAGIALIEASGDWHREAVTGGH